MWSRVRKVTPCTRLKPSCRRRGIWKATSIRHCVTMYRCAIGDAYGVQTRYCVAFGQDGLEDDSAKKGPIALPGRPPSRPAPFLSEVKRYLVKRILDAVLRGYITHIRGDMIKHLSLGHALMLLNIHDRLPIITFSVVSFFNTVALRCTPYRANQSHTMVLLEEICTAQCSNEGSSLQITG